MSSRKDRFDASMARFWSGCFTCCFAIGERQYLDVRVRSNGAGTDRIADALISVFQAGTNILVARERTDALGDVILRLRPGNYDVHAQKAWHIPETDQVNGVALANRAAVTVRFNKQPLYFYMHMDADRDGAIDGRAHDDRDKPAPAWGWGPNGRGAIILCNNDNDGLPNPNDPDNTDTFVNANNDADELAHIEIQRHGPNVATPGGWAASLSVRSLGGDLNPQDNVRIFNGVAANDGQLVGPGAAQAAVPNFDAAPKQLGMEALRYAGDGFNGEVCVRLTVTCPDPLGGVDDLSYFTEEIVRVAPWLMPTHLDRPDRVYVSDLGNDNQAFRNTLVGLVGGAQDAHGNAPGFTAYDDPRTLDTLRDRWMQDCMEIGYSNFPGNGNGPMRIDSYMKAQRDHGAFDLKHYPMAQLAAQIGHTYPVLANYVAALAVPGGAAVQAASLALQALPLAPLDADAIAHAMAARINAGDSMTDVAAAAAFAAAQVEGAPAVGQAVSIAVGVAAIQTVITEYNTNGAANPTNTYNAAFAQAGGNAACARAATFAAEAIVAAFLDWLANGLTPNVTGQNAAAAAAAAIQVITANPTAAPGTAGQDALTVIQGGSADLSFSAMLVAYTTAMASGITAAQAEDAVEDVLICLDEMLFTAIPTTTFDSTGNLEVTPPVRSRNAAPNGPKDYRWGRIYYGCGPNRGNFNAQTLAFLRGQRVQDPIALNTDWLAVGHVDEMISFVPDRRNTHWNRKWKLLIVSPRLAYQILTAAPQGAPVMNGRRLRYGQADTTAGDISCRTNVNACTIPFPGRPGHQITWQQLMTWNTGPLQHVIDAVRDSLVNEIGLDINRDVIEVPVVFMPERRIAGGGVRFDPNHSRRHGLNVLPGTPGGFISGALTADMVNMLVLNDHLIIPQAFGPEVVAEQTADNPTGDLFVKQLIDDLDDANDDLEPHFIDDWTPYHAQMGEVHCGTNTLRRPRPADVANWLANEPEARWWEFPG